MRKPHKSTLDRWLDDFSDWNTDDQEKALDLCALIHRQTKRRKPEPAEPMHHIKLTVRRQALVPGVGLDAAGGKA